MYDGTLFSGVSVALGVAYDCDASSASGLRTSETLASPQVSTGLEEAAAESVKVSVV
jgi:hypothetical protein